MYPHNCAVSLNFLLLQSIPPNPPSLFPAIDFLQKLGHLSFRMFHSLDFSVCSLVVSFILFFYLLYFLKIVVNFKRLNKFRFNFCGKSSSQTVCVIRLPVRRYCFCAAKTDQWVPNLFLGFFFTPGFLFSLSSSLREL